MIYHTQGQHIYHNNEAGFILQWQHLPTNIACLIYFLILVSYNYPAILNRK
jgi:hypothetical protein